VGDNIVELPSDAHPLLLYGGLGHCLLLALGAVSRDGHGDRPLGLDP
jgi:hypothetical protein